MRIKIEVSQSRAIEIGRNTTSWETEIDVTALTDAQREKLAYHTYYNNKTSDLIDAAGEITAASIQAVLDKEAAKKAAEEAAKQKELEGFRAEAVKHEKLVEAYAAGQPWDATAYSMLSYKYRTYDTLLGVEKTRDVLIAQKAAIDERHIEEWDARYADAIAAYDSGSRLRPSWKETWGGSETALKKICEIDKRRAEEEKQIIERNKLQQLSYAVEALGTDSQKERWAAGVMPRSEALGLIRSEWLAPLCHAGIDPLHNAYHLEESSEYGQEIEIEESEKMTLTDEQWAVVKKCCAALPDAQAKYYHQHQTDVDEPESCDLVRLTQKIGEYTLECDVII
jgi:hypothetical protein